MFTAAAFVVMARAAFLMLRTNFSVKAHTMALFLSMSVAVS